MGAGDTGWRRVSHREGGLCPWSCTNQALGPVPGAVTIRGMGGRMPAPRENPANLGAGGQQALAITFRR